MDQVSNPAVSSTTGTPAEDWNVSPQPRSILRSYLTRTLNKPEEAEANDVCPTLRSLLTSRTNLTSNEAERNQLQFGIASEILRVKANELDPREISIPVKKRKIFDASVPFRTQLGPQEPQGVIAYAPRNSIQEAVVSTTTHFEEVHSFSKAYYPPASMNRLATSGTSPQCPQSSNSRCSI